MSHLEMESLLHYERNLAACYEAEYLLELTMQREYISGGIATNRTGYEDSSELQLVTSHPHTFTSLAATHAAEMANVPFTPSNHYIPSPQQPNPSLPTSAPTEAPVSLHTHQHSHTLLNHTSQTPVFTSTVDPHLHLHPPLSTPLTMMPPSPSHHTAQSKPRGRYAPTGHLSAPHYQGVCANGVTEAHSEGPQRKKMCLQRPEM